MTQLYALLQRNLLYTGVTRGKKLVILVGQPKAVAIAVKNETGRRRWSKLNEWLAPRRYVGDGRKAELVPLVEANPKELPGASRAGEAPGRS